jgi:hypothetical protein
MQGQITQAFEAAVRAKLAPAPAVLVERKALIGTRLDLS